MLVLPVLAVILGGLPTLIDTIILGLCILYCHYWQHFVWPMLIVYSHTASTRNTKVYTLNTPRIILVWHILRSVSVHTAACRLASVMSSIQRRTDHQLAASQERGLAAASQTVYTARSDG